MDVRHCSPPSIVLVVGLLTFSSNAPADSEWREVRDQAAHFSAGAAGAYVLDSVFGLPDWIVWSTVMGGALVREAAQKGVKARSVAPRRGCGPGCQLDMTFYALGTMSATDAPPGVQVVIRDRAAMLIWVKGF